MKNKLKSDSLITYAQQKSQAKLGFKRKFRSSS